MTAAISRARSIEPLVPGEVIARRYQVDRKVAMGAMGEVWAGTHVQLKRKIAMKVLRSDAISNPEIGMRFEREAFLLGRASGDHVARVIDFFQSTRHGPILVMEFVEGPSLAQVLRDRTLGVEEAIDLAIDICHALRELHAMNVVHRDVKPANIMLQPRPDGTRRVVFVDLGVSRLLHDVHDELPEITSVDRAVGTVEYMAPEQILCSRDAGAPADIYALGSILVRALTGRHVFGEMRGTALVRHKLVVDAPPLRLERTDDIARRLERIVTRALAIMPEDRYVSAEDMLDDLMPLRQLRAPESGTRLKAERRSFRWMWRALAVLVLLGAPISAGQSEIISVTQT